jgi:ribosomal protein S12 methylthiotransferase accessory factor
MLFEGIPFAQRRTSDRNTLAERAMDSFLGFIERKLGVTITYDARHIPFGRPDLLEGSRVADTLKQTGVIKSFFPVRSFPDEPPLSLWSAVCGDKKDRSAGGGTWKNDPGALMATLAEALERYVWWEERDYFTSPIRATYNAIQKYGSSLAPERFAAFSAAQREENPRWKLEPSSSFLWIRGTSLVTGKPTYLPAQTVSGIHNSELFRGEPLIRHRNTTGLATWPTQTGARLAGALEVIEREAYMIMWLNQLVLPRIPLEKVCAQSASLSELIEVCERYRLKVHVIKLLTDAPAHAVCVVIEDASGIAPRYAFGLKARGSLSDAIEGAITEALRARGSYRRFFSVKNDWNPETPAHKIGHYDRMYYWGVERNAKKLEFLIKGEEHDMALVSWENDTPEQHLKRITDWCHNLGYECVSVSLGTSKKNPMPWSIEMVVMPELQPTHLEENLQKLGGERWKSVPRQFGITPRAEPFSEEPHPFA